MDLLSEWRKAAGQWDAGPPPYILEADAGYLKSYPTVTYHSWDEAWQAPDFFCPDRSKDRRLHLGLLPGPFVGDLLNAQIYVLMTNPGLELGDYVEHEKTAFRSVLLANLKQEPLDSVLPFLCLDRQFAWHGAFKYWDSKLWKTIQELASNLGISEPQARAKIGETLAVIQESPYHSATGPDDTSSWPSVRLAGEFVRDTVTKRVRDKRAIVIAMRRVGWWNYYIPEDLGEDQGVIRSANSGEARAANLQPTSRAGRAILRHLTAVPSS